MKFQSMWEKRDGRIICRAAVAWRDVAEGTLAGCVAGYSGGGAFQLEQFFCAHEGGTATSLLIDTRDHITGDEVDFFDDVQQVALDVCDDAQDHIYGYCDRYAWEDKEQLRLIDGKEADLRQGSEPDVLVAGPALPKPLARLCEFAGLTAKLVHE